ncbi:MAG: MFS transporter [Promethearchaeota archaeon]
MALYAAQNEKEDPIMGNDGQRAETEPLKSRVGISTRSLFTGNYLVLLISWILMDFAGELPGTYYQDYVIILGGSATILGLIAMVSFLCIASVQFLGGYMADKYGRRKLIVTLTFGVALSYIFYALAPSWHFILIGAAIQNLVLLYQPALFAMMADSVPPEKRGTGFSILNLIMNVATTPAPAVALLLVSIYGSEFGMRIAYTIVTIVFTIAAIWRIRLSESMTHPETMNLKEAVRSYPKALREGINVWRKVPRSTFYLLITQIIFRFSFSMVINLFLVYAFYNLQIGGTPNPILDPNQDPALQLARERWGFVSIAVVIAMIITSLPVGKLMDKVGRKIPLLLSNILLVPSLLIFIYGDYLLLYVAMILIGIVRLLAFSAYQALFADFVPQELRGKVTGSRNFFAYIFMAIGGLAGGILYDTVSPQLPFLFLILLSVPSIVIVAFRIHELKPEERHI